MVIFIFLAGNLLAVGTTDGIYFIDGGEVTGNLTKQDGLRNSQILSLTKKDHVLYGGCHYDFRQVPVRCIIPYTMPRAV